MRSLQLLFAFYFLLLSVLASPIDSSKLQNVVVVSTKVYGCHKTENANCCDFCSCQCISVAGWVFVKKTDNIAFTPLCGEILKSIYRLALPMGMIDLTWHPPEVV